jgi:hypothetical protein
MQQATPTLSRRHVIAGLTAALPAAVAAPALAASNPDAALLALEPEIERLAAERARLLHIWAYTPTYGPKCAQAEAGMYAATDALFDALRVLEEVPARTLEGLRFKARMVAHDEDLAEVVVRDLLRMQSA